MLWLERTCHILVSPPAPRRSVGTHLHLPCYACTEFWNRWTDGNIHLETGCALPKNNAMNTSLAAPGALAHRLQRRTACNT